jgi:uroporphyrinogen III methyltransferase / synthase
MCVARSIPLLNKTIFAVCSAKKMAELQAGLESMGGRVVPLPVIEPSEIEDKRDLDRALRSLDKHSWIIFSSVYGVAFFAKRVDELGIRINTAAQKICAVGPATAKALKEAGLEPALVPEEYVAEGVVQALDRYHGGLQNLAGHCILLPRALEARDTLPNALIEAGAKVDVVPCYQTMKADLGKAMVARLRATVPDLIVFTSSSTIKNLMAILGQDYGKSLLLNSTVAVIGPITAKTAESFGKAADVIPKENTVASLIEAIRERYDHTGS